MRGLLWEAIKWNIHFLTVLQLQKYPILYEIHFWTQGITYLKPLCIKRLTSSLNS